MHDTIAAVIKSIPPGDPLERDHQEQALAWIGSGAPLCRIEKPATPPQHLVSYIVVVDPAERKVLLVDHKIAGLWLPSGGHVEPGEHPQHTVERELREELGIEPVLLYPAPIFLTVTETVGAAAGHVDVSLWYVVQASCHQDLLADPAEFHAVGWFAFDRIPYPRTDPHLARFMAKLEALLVA